MPLEAQAKANPQSLTIVIADDDQDDQLMVREALLQNRNVGKVVFVENGEDLLNYLSGAGPYAESPPPSPDLILLDLNMPRKNGVETLREIRSEPKLQHIPIVILTTSREEEDIEQSYDLGVNSFITKPFTYNALMNTMKILGKYWFDVVQLPSERTVIR